MDRYPQDLPGVMKLLNNYITESGNSINFRKIFRNEQTGVSFTKTQEKDVKDKKISTARVSLTVSTTLINIIDYCCVLT